MKEGQKLWTKEELILAINLYCKLPFGRMHSRNPEIIAFADMIGRTPGSVALKLGNFASLDPSLRARGIKGASNGSKLDKEVWDMFFNDWNALPYQSEVLLAQYKQTTVEALHEIHEPEMLMIGKEKEQLIRARVNQSLFRSTILAAYEETCCITGITQRELLIAGHIRPWGLDEKNRLNPRNGIAINALHDKAFETGFITITPDYTIKVSPEILKHTSSWHQEFFGRYENQPIHLPKRFLPDTEFLKYHNEVRFRA